ncbi:MAG: glycoside hydrolase family 3 C-terminal domain-containing protein, partial [Aldersonia sp.]|nr:glycoside hydrolase family 3 C-terminal domain-containing protein [Aldersonia sp.]
RESRVRLGVSTTGATRLYADGRVLVDEQLGDPSQPFAAGVSSADLRVHGPVDVVVRQELDPRTMSFGLMMIALGTQPADTDIDSLIDEAAAVAAESDVAVVVVGTTAQTESEGSDRTTLALPGARDALVRAVAGANPRTVVVVNSGAPVLMPWRDDVAALLLTWFGGQEYGHALADVLLGRHEPGGRLPTTWPAEESDVPVLSTTPTDGVMQYREGIHIGYRAWLKSAVPPAYWFGYGLGYTTWALSDLRVSAPRPDGAVDLTVAVHNTGSRAGKQVVQVYLSRSDSAVDRPVRWLAGFATATAEAGETHHSAVMVPARAFAHWDDGWQTEAGTFTLHVGTSVVDLPLNAEITIDA